MRRTSSQPSTRIDPSSAFVLEFLGNAFAFNTLSANYTHFESGQQGGCRSFDRRQAHSAWPRVTTHTKNLSPRPKSRKATELKMTINIMLTIIALQFNY